MKAFVILKLIKEYFLPFLNVDFTTLYRFDHYSKLKDVQTLAMLALTFNPPAETKQTMDLSRRSSHSYNTVKRSMSHQSLDVTVSSR